MMPALVVVGSLNMDFVVSVDRLPVPGETVLGRDFRMIPGGKGANQACAAGKLGVGAVALIFVTLAGGVRLASGWSALKAVPWKTAGSLVQWTPSSDRARPRRRFSAMSRPVSSIQ